jgi:hypothetical protein
MGRVGRWNFTTSHSQNRERDILTFTRLPLDERTGPAEVPVSDEFEPLRREANLLAFFPSEGIDRPPSLI